MLGLLGNHSCGMIIFLLSLLYYSPVHSLSLQQLTASGLVSSFNPLRNSLTSSLSSLSAPFSLLTQQNIQSTLEPIDSDPVVEDPFPLVYFTGAGTYLWWQLGVAKYIQETLDRDDILNLRFAGASAGSATATLLLTNADFDKAPQLAIDIAKRYDVFSRKTGLTGICGEMMRIWLDEMIQDENFNIQDLQKLSIALTPSIGSPKLVDSFQSKSDLLDAIMASCHVPIFMDGKVLTSYKGEPVLDGSFWYFVTKNRYNGLPIPQNTDLNKLTWVDYSDDEAFLQRMSGNFLELTKPEMTYEMMQYGYDYMKKESLSGRTPFAPQQKKMFRFPTVSFYSAVTKSVPNAKILSESLLRSMPSTDFLQTVPSKLMNSLGSVTSGSA